MTDNLDQAQCGIGERKGPMPETQRTLRVLVVDDDRDGADALGMIVEELGSQVHVTYGGMSARDVAILFRPDLMLIDLAMPDMDGCQLVASFRQIPAFAQTRIVAITGHADEGHKTLAMKSGFDQVLFKPVALAEITAAWPVLSRLHGGPTRQPAQKRASPRAEQRLPISETRRIRKELPSRSLTQQKAKQPSARGSFASKRNTWDGERSRFAYT